MWRCDLLLGQQRWPCPTLLAWASAWFRITLAAFTLGNLDLVRVKSFGFLLKSSKTFETSNKNANQRLL